jgi:uncharacterized damage-inducible protein DinB
MEKDTADNFLESAIYQLESFRCMAEKALDQINDEQLNWHKDSNSLSIATIMKHLSANMQSRWTDFLNTDGEKEWRRQHREDEFVNAIAERDDLLKTWDKGWTCFIESLQSLTANDLGRIVYIRNEGYTVIEATHRGLTHAAYHVGQIVYLAKMFKSDKWQSLSIPKGESVAFNKKKFSKERSRRIHK